MENSKLYLLFKSLHSEELKELKKWIVSPIANQHQDVIKLFNYLFSKKQLTPKLLEKTVVFFHLYPLQPFDDLRFRHVLSISTKCVENFIKYNSYITDDYLSDLVLIKSFVKHQQPKFAQALLLQKKETLQNTTIRDSNYYLTLAELEKIDLDIQSHQVRNHSFNLQTISTVLHQYIQLDILRCACLAITNQQIYNTEFSFPLLKEILSIIENDSDQTETAVKIYYNIYKALTEKENDLYIYSLKNILIHSKNIFSYDELRDVFLLIINLSIRKQNSGQKEFLNVTYEFYHLLIANNLLLQNNELDRFLFTNIAFTGLNVKDFEGVENFIEKYALYLPDVYREPIVAFTTARLYYTQQLYDKAIPLLLQTEYKDVLMSLSARLILTKIYIETKSFDIAANYITTFKKYLRRQKNIGYHQERSLRILAYCEQLITTLATTKKKKLSFIKKINEDELLNEKEWFLEQIQKS